MNRHFPVVGLFRCCRTLLVLLQPGSVCAGEGNLLHKVIQEPVFNGRRCSNPLCFPHALGGVPAPFHVFWIHFLKGCPQNLIQHPGFYRKPVAAVFSEAAHRLLFLLHMHLSGDQRLTAVRADDLAVHIRVPGDFTPRCPQFQDALYLFEGPLIDDRNMTVFNPVGRHFFAVIRNALMRFEVRADPFLQDHIPGIPFVPQNAEHS